MTLQMRAALKVRVHCPVSRETFAALLRGELAAIETDVNAAKFLAIIRGRNPLGDFDLYQGVFEVSLGVEGFTSTIRATPTAGAAGTNTLSPTVVITVYIDAAANRGEVHACLSALMQAHPWETPVIEFDDQPVQLLVRSARIHDAKSEGQISK